MSIKIMVLSSESNKVFTFVVIGSYTLSIFLIVITFLDLISVLKTMISTRDHLKLTIMMTMLSKGNK
jgi:hypothetical protein